MTTLRERIGRDPGGAYVVFAIVAVIALYASTVGRGLVNYDDHWLVRDNFYLRELSLATLGRIFFDTSSATRFILGAEYLPLRDVSIGLDGSLWGDWYGGFHLTNIVLYLAAIVIWFRVLLAFGIERAVAGLAILLWALHPTHAESVAWISERKGLLGSVFAGLAALGYARYRRGDRPAWLLLALIAAPCAVWSKAPFAFAIAALAPLELVLPVRRASGRRVLVALGALGVVGAAAFVPVLVTATNLRVVATADQAPAGWLEMVLGTHGFYVQLGFMTFRNAIAYPISTQGPTLVDIVVGTVSLVVLVVVAVGPGRLRTVAPLRIAAIIWLFGWLPVSRLVLPLKAVLMADRYLVFASLGLTLAAAFGLSRIASTRARRALIAVIVVAAAMRTLDAQSSWRDTVTLWQRAVQSNPHDGVAWSSYVEALEDAGQEGLAFDALRKGLRHSRAPRLLLRKALLVLDKGDRPTALRTMEDAAEAGEPRAMVNLAVMLVQDGRLDEALTWARKSTEIAPLYAKGYKTIGGVLMAQGRLAEAVTALERAHELWPVDVETRHDLAAALIALGRHAEARPHVVACLFDPKVGASARALLLRLPR